MGSTFSNNNYQDSSSDNNENITCSFNNENFSSSSSSNNSEEDSPSVDYDKQIITSYHDRIANIKNYLFKIYTGKNGKNEINVSNNSHSSSLLPMDQNHVIGDPTSKYIKKEIIETIKLDDIYDKYCLSKNVLLKIEGEKIRNLTLNNCNLTYLDGI